MHALKLLCLSRQFAKSPRSQREKLSISGLAESLEGDTQRLLEGSKTERWGPLEVDSPKLSVVPFENSRGESPELLSFKRQNSRLTRPLPCAGRS